MTTRLNGTEFETLNRPQQRGFARMDKAATPRILSRRIARATRRQTRAI